MAKKKHAGELLDGLKVGLDDVKDRFWKLLPDLRELSERSEVQNSGMIEVMAENCAGYIGGLVGLVMVFREGRKES